MIRLHPETGEEIANLITKIDVAKIMHDRPRIDLEERCFWQAEEFKAIICLSEEYGIPHNNYDHAVKHIKLDMYANATL